MLNLQQEMVVYGLFGSVSAVQDIEFKDFTLGQGLLGVSGSYKYGIVASINGEKKVTVSDIQNNFEKDIVSQNVGGIIGVVDGNVSLDIKNCYNSSNITNYYGSGSRTGGIIGGFAGNSRGVVRNCINKGKIEGVYRIGGIIGGFNEECEKIEITSCENDSKISGAHIRRNYWRRKIWKSKNRGLCK